MATTYEQVLALLNELAQGQAELLRAQQETDRKFQDTDRKFQETERKFQETEWKFQEMARLVSGLGGQWGLFMENQVAPACERVFSERGIPVQMVSQRVKKLAGAWGGGGDAALKTGRIATPTGRDCSSWRRPATR